MSSATLGKCVSRGAWGTLLTLIYLFLLGPIIVVLILSFDTRRFLSFPPQSYSLGSYAAVLANPRFVNAFWVSLGIGMLVGLLALGAGVLISLALVRHRFRGREVVSWAVIAPFAVPHIILAVGILLVLAPIGLLDSVPGVVLAHLGITIPYVVRTVSASLLAVDMRVEEAARVHGASPLTVFRRITLPLILPGLIAGGAIAFLTSFDESTISLFIVNQGLTLLPVEIYHYVEYRTDPQVAALSTLLIVVSIVVVVLIERLVGLRRVLR